MTAAARGALERAPILARRGVMLAVPLLLVGVLVAGFALAPTPAGRPAGRPAASGGLLPPARAPARRPPVAAPPTEQTTAHSVTVRPEAPIGAGSAHAGGRVGDPDRAPSSHSSSGEMLAVARAFAVAYMPYQVGRMPGWVRAAIRRTCSREFADYLLSRPAEQSLLLSAHPKDAETYRVTSVNLAAGTDRVSVSWVSEQDRADTGAFLLTVTRRYGRWLVAGLET
jgi:hypothetical protein